MAVLKTGLLQKTDKGCLAKVASIEKSSLNSLSFEIWQRFERSETQNGLKRSKLNEKKNGKGHCRIRWTTDLKGLGLKPTGSLTYIISSPN